MYYSTPGADRTASSLHLCANSICLFLIKQHVFPPSSISTIYLLCQSKKKKWFGNRELLSHYCSQNQSIYLFFLLLKCWWRLPKMKVGVLFYFELDSLFEPLLVCLWWRKKLAAFVIKPLGTACLGLALQTAVCISLCLYFFSLCTSPWISGRALTAVFSILLCG